MLQYSHANYPLNSLLVAEMRFSLQKPHCAEHLRRSQNSCSWCSSWSRSSCRSFRCSCHDHDLTSSKMRRLNCCWNYENGSWMTSWQTRRTWRRTGCLGHRSSCCSCPVSLGSSSSLLISTGLDSIHNNWGLVTLLFDPAVAGFPGWPKCI